MENSQKYFYEKLIVAFQPFVLKSYQTCELLWDSSNREIKDGPRIDLWQTTDNNNNIGVSCLLGYTEVLELYQSLLQWQYICITIKEIKKNDIYRNTNFFWYFWLPRNILYTSKYCFKYFTEDVVFFRWPILTPMN